LTGPYYNRLPLISNNIPAGYHRQQAGKMWNFLLPVNAPQSMLAYGTGAFTVKDFIKAGIPLTIVGYLLILLFSATYWKWVGLL
jgi:solute carrier family 13 (sodium-dependent dicarboxylate transporter), member 2/3/5